MCKDDGCRIICAAEWMRNLNADLAIRATIHGCCKRATDNRFGRSSVATPHARKHAVNGAFVQAAQRTKPLLRLGLKCGGTGHGI